MRLFTRSFSTSVLWLMVITGSAQQNKGDSLYHLAQSAPLESQSHSLLKAADVYYQTDPKKAITVAEEALTAATTEQQKATCELSIGKYQYIVGSHEQALTWYLKSLKTYEALHDTNGQATVLNEIGTLVKKQGNIEKSATYFRDALKLAIQSNDSTQIANSMNNLGIAMEMLGKTDEALKLYTQSADIKRNLNDFNGLSYNLDNLGMLYTSLKKFEQAEASFNEAAKIRLQLGDRRGYGIVINNLGEMWQIRNNPDKALDYFTQALAIAEETNYADFRKHLYQVLASVYEQQKNFEKALYYSHQYQQLNDSIFNQQKSRQLLEMETKYETEKKELLIQDQQLKLERTQIMTIGLVIVLAFIALLILQWRRQSKLQEQRKLERHQRENQEKLTRTVITLQEKERSRFAQDLHDGFGQLITALKIQFEKLGQRNDGISELIQHMHDEIRNVSFALSPQVLVRDGLVQALKELSFRINRSSAISMNVQATGIQKRLPSDYEITLYRICQEWINNVLKYSGATEISVQLIEHPDEIVLMIEDNGTGFDSSALETSSGNGWKNIQSRVQILNGQVEVDSSPARSGTTFTANIPL
ncbi:MAG: sensor histidine kinase [Cyclobacteriaceae bacterium]